MNLPNKLTLLRIALSFVLWACLLLPGFWLKLAAVIVFAAASLTDLWDGRLARRWGLVSDFGALMDPIADKVLVLVAFLSFMQLRIVPGWMVAVIAARELLITVVRFFALGKGKVLPAEAAGKYKTVSQMAAISLVLLFLLLREVFGPSVGGVPWVEPARQVISVSMWLTLGLTLFSGLSFFWNNRKLILGL